MLQPYTKMKGIPLRGGCITVREKTALEFGQFSMVQNIRAKYPGFEKRPGQRKLHATADSTNQCMTLYQFNKQRITETHFYAQFSDGDVLESTEDPPDVAAGVFGTVEAHSGTTKANGMIPASWGNLDDILLYSNGADQHQLFAGDTNYVGKVLKYDSGAAPPNIPEHGTDYSIEATDGLTTTVVDLSSLNTYANNECLYIYTPIPANRLTFTISLPNGTAAVGTLKYRKSDGTWADTSETDGTIDTGATMGQSGSMTWTHPADEISHYMYGKSGFWYQWETSVQLDGEVEITKITYGSDFQDLRNVWDGLIPYAIEVLVEQAAGIYETYAAGSVNVSEVASATKLYIGCADPIQGIYIDPGSIVDTNKTAMTTVKYWDGAAYQSVGTVTDGSDGLTHPGWITFPRQDAQPRILQSSNIYMYWYELTLPAETMPTDMVLAIYYWPVFDIEEFGKGVTNCAWKHRGCYTFTLFGEYIYVSSSYLPMGLNGDDYGILLAGDGRTNKVVAMERFHNELMVWQEEKGVEGGCLTLFQGYDPSTWGKLLLSSKVGTMNAKSVAVVDGVLTSTTTEERIKTLAFSLSRYGVTATDGKTVSLISDDIQNYFDPTEPECIRRGYEKEMWLKHDSAYNCIRIGLVSGPTATVPNIFPIFDLTDKTWGFDVLGQELSCIAEVESQASYTIDTITYDPPVIQVGGGVDDGFVYQLNVGKDDVTDAIDAFFEMELNAGGEYVQLTEIIIRAVAVATAAGDITLTLSRNSNSAGTKTLSMSPELTNQTVRRHRFSLNVCDQNVTIKMQNATAAKTMELLDMGLKTFLYATR